MSDMSSIPKWWQVMRLRSEVVNSNGAVDDVQMSLHDAVFGRDDVGAGRTPYAEPAYFGDITYPTGSLVEFMANIAVRLGVAGGTQTSSVWRLDQAMGGGKSHGLIGLWHLATHPTELQATDLGRRVFAKAHSIAGPGNVRDDLGEPICVVLDCDNTSATEENFGPAKRLGERFLWRLFDTDFTLYTEFQPHTANKAELARALRMQDRPVLVLIDEVMDYIRVVAAEDPDGAALDMGFVRALLDAINDVPNCAAVVVMIASDQDHMAMTDAGQQHREEFEQLLTRNAQTTSVTGGGDFSNIIRRRLFDTLPQREHTDAVAGRFLSDMKGLWQTRVFGKLKGYSDREFRDRLARTYPFHPDLIALAEDEWATHAGFQRVRSMIRVFAAAAHEHQQRADNDSWVPELIDSGDLPLSSPQLREALLNSGLVADERTQSNLREVASVDIVDPHNPGRGTAETLDAATESGWVSYNPRATERMATALFLRSLCPRAGGTRGATEAELLAASFVPSNAFGPGDAEAVFVRLLESDEGMASVDAIPGRSGSAPKRWVIETRMTLSMLAKAEKKAVTDEDRDWAVTERAFDLANGGLFNEVIFAAGGEHPSERITTEQCRSIIAETGIDRKLSNRLVILDSRWFSLFNGDDTATRESVESAMGLGMNAMPMMWARSAVFACAHTNLRAQARGLAANWLAHQRVAEMPSVTSNEDSLRAAKQAAREALDQFDRRVRACYRHVLYLGPADVNGRMFVERRLPDTQTALNGNDVWAQLREDNSAYRPTEFSKNSLLHALRDNDYGKPLSEIRDDFWSNPQKGMLPGGTSDLAAAIYRAITDQDVELVDPAGNIYEVHLQGDINLATTEIRLRRHQASAQTCDECGNSTEECTCGTHPPGTTPDPGEQPGPGPTGPPAQHWQLSININTSIGDGAAREQIRELIDAITCLVDDGHATHINQMAQITIKGERESVSAVEQLAHEAGMPTSVREI